MGAKGGEWKKNKNSKNKSKKKQAAGPNVVAMKHKAPAPNPFETIWSRSKFDVLGKKRKGEERRIGLARSLAIDKRKKTLLKEYEQSGKASVFLDKRIGEHNDELEEFDKAILRSQRERQMKLSKRSKYNLSDGEEDELDFGAEGNLLGRDDFQDDMEPQQEEDDAYPSKKTANSKQIPSDDHEEGEEIRHKSKKEVMEEIISKSKYHKEQNRKAKEDNEQLMEQLDREFETLVQSEALSSTQPNQMRTTNNLVTNIMSNVQIKKDESLGHLTEGITIQSQPDAYEKILKTMQLEMRARPSDRTKTPEEIAQEEKERLEKLEEERQKRMMATDDSSDDEPGHKDVKHAIQKPRSISGDDLGDSFEIDEEEPNSGWVDAILQRKESRDDESEDGDSSQSSGTDEDGSDEESGEDDESREDNGDCPRSVSLKDWEQDDDDDDDDDDDNDNFMSDSGKEVKKERDNEGEGREKDSGIALRKKKLDAKSTGDKNALSIQLESLPYTIEAPSSFEELSKLLENRSDEDIIEAIKRIRNCNAIALKAENRKKMQVFYGLLLQYFAVSASRKPFNFQLLNSLASPLIEMSAEIPYFSAICARQRVMRTRMQLCDAIKNRDRSCWPATKTLFLLRLWSMIYPCSDFRHVVMTPATLLMCEYLMRCQIACGRDIAIGIFLCSMILSVAKQSQKLYPEALKFIQTILMAAMNKKTVSYQDTQFYFLAELKALEPLLCLSDQSTEITPLDFLMIMELPEDSSFFSSDSFRGGIMVSLIETLGGFIGVYGQFSSFSEMFLPMSKMMLEIANRENMPLELRGKLKEVAQLINKKAQEQYLLRQPLQMQKQKPVAIKLVNPKFEENYVKGRDYDPDRERAEARRLKKQIKQEGKGAVRELRKDNYFLFEVKEKQKSVHEEERAEKYGKAKAFLQEQEHAFKSGQLGKGGKRRRRG